MRRLGYHHVQKSGYGATGLVRETLDVHIAIDRRLALASGEALATAHVGAVLFADIAGFSRLTGDLLETSGARRGAEELTIALDAIYDALVAPVHAHGGSVVTFSGDAITCVFPDDDGHAAATAASSMHAASAGLFVQIGAQRRPIRIKIGLAHGFVHRLAPGDPAHQRIDTLAGEPVLDAALAERRAEPGETIAAPSLRMALGERAVLGEPRGDGFVVLLDVDTRAPERPWPTPPTLPYEVSSPFVHAALRKEIDAGRSAFLAELRAAVPIFVRFEGLHFAHDESAAMKLDAFVSFTQSVLAGFGGALIGVTLGDKGSYLNGAFGAPTSYEDDASRALAAATALLSRPPSLAWVSNVGIGLCSGRMRAGTFGGKSRRTYAVLGSHGNIAARMMERARDGEILVDRSVVDAAQATHRFEPAGSVRVKGSGTDVEVFACVGRATHRRTSTDDDADEDSLIGRRDETRAFEDALDARDRGQGSILLLVGEAGIGKSRVVRALLARARRRGARLLTVTGDAIEQTSAYHAFRATFAATLGLDELTHDDEVAARAHVRAHIAGSKLARFAPLLEPVLPFTFPDDDVTQALTGEARADTARELMTSILLPDPSAQPPIVLVDDAHFLDASSWALLARLRAEREDAIVVVSTRPIEESALPREWVRLAEAPNATRIDLGALPRGDLEQLVSRRAGARRVDDAILHFVHDRAGGHPFFTEQLLRVLLELGRAEVIGDRCVTKASRDELETTDFPATIEGVVASRLDRLPSNELLALKIASVLGRSFDTASVAALHPDAPSPAAMIDLFEQLCGRDLLVREGSASGYAFRHAILQRVTYDRMLFSQRRELHARAARFIESSQGDDVAATYPILAHHFRRAEDDVRAVSYLDRAAEHAIRQGAYDEAIRLVRGAMELDPNATLGVGPDRRARRLSILGDAEMNLGAIKESRATLEGALVELGRPVPKSVVAVVGRALVEATTQLAHRVAPKVFVRRAGDAERRAFASQILRNLQPVYFLHNALEHMLYATLRAVNLSEAARGLALAEEVRAEGYAAAALIASAVGAERIAASYRLRAVATGDAHGDAATLGQIWLLLALHSIGIGACGRAIGEAARARALFEASSQRRRFEIACGTFGWASGYVGRFDDGIASWTDSRVAAVQRGDRQSIANGCCGIAEQLLSRGRAEDLPLASEMIARAIENLPLGNDRMFELHVLGMRAVVHAREGRTALALEDFERATKAMEASVPLSGYSAAAYARPADGVLDLVEAGALDARAPIVRRAVRGATRFAKSFRVGRTRALRAEGRFAAALGDVRSARRALDAALAQARALELPLDEALARFEIARLAPMERDSLEAAISQVRAIGLGHEPAHAERVAELASGRRVRG